MGSIELNNEVFDDQWQDYDDTIQSLMEDEVLAQAYLAAGHEVPDVDETWFSQGFFYGTR